MSTILCLLCLCRNTEYGGNLQNKTVISKQLFCQMSSQVKWEGRPFWSGQVAQIYSLNYLLPTYRGNINYYKSVHHPILTLPVGTLLSIEFPDIFSSCLKWRGKRDLFGRVQEGGPHCHITWLILVRDEIWNNPTPPLFFIRSSYK